MTENVRLTIATVPKPSIGHIDTIQRNALDSWKRLRGAEVIVFGDEPGVREAAAAVGARHEPVIARNALGTPLVSDAFARARQLARSRVIVFANTDVVFADDFADAIDVMARSSMPQWVVVGQRYDLDVRERLDMSNGWQESLRRAVTARGALHGKSGIDFFGFPIDLPIVLPPMAVGRVGWDSWLVYATRKAGIPLVDVTRAVCVVHQNHPPAHDPAGLEADDNRRSAGGYFRMGSIRDANWQLVRQDDRIRLAPRLAGRLWFSSPVRVGLAVRRALSRRLTGSRV